MAKYTTTVRSPWSADKAFAYVADLENLAEWDPGVASSEQTTGDGPAVDAVYKVAASGATLHYKVTAYDEPTLVGMRATSKLFDSIDAITFTKTADGCEVTYEAELKLNGALGVFDFGLGLMFNYIGGKAANGLAKALDGEIV